MVEVERSKSGEYWRMSYMGESEIIDEEPTDAEKSRFMKSVNEQKKRERIEARVSRGTGGHQYEIQRVG